jgi:small-conductance mechanosensitive channel
MHFLGINWLGVNAVNLRKLELSIGFLIAVFALHFVLRAASRLVLPGKQQRILRGRFWLRQAISMFTALLCIFGLISIWFDNPARLTTAFGLMSAGVAFALQQVITAFAGYFVILRGKNFTVGDRITMGGVRGDVIALGFIQTQIMEMGEPISGDAAPATWVKSRQFTGRIVSVSNAQIFSDPVFNYTRDFPYIWEELTLPVRYQDDRARAEQIMLDAARRHGVDPSVLDDVIRAVLEQKYHLPAIDLMPKVFWRITDNWLELTVRFIFSPHGTRNAKDLMSRDILAGLDAAGIGIASATYDIVGLPPVAIQSK